MANQRNIASACMVYTSEHGVFPVASESPQINLVYGPRTLPLILKDTRIISLSSSDGGIFRCPLDKRDYEPHFAAWYWFREGGPGAPGDVSDSGFSGSYSGNCVYRITSSRTPWSYWNDDGGQFKFIARRPSLAANPSGTVWFYDSFANWGVSANSPYQLFGTWWTLESPGSVNYGYLRRHDPESVGPCGNAAFLDGHVEYVDDFLDTCADDNLNEDAAKSLRYWSLTGE
jgi:prepilin-type processing-associated H-X9-DG protein